MPKIGCGLDKLDWNAVRTMIKNVFLETPIKIDVYCLETDIKPENHKASAVVNPTSTQSESDRNQRRYPMLDIAEGNLTPIVQSPSKSKSSKTDEVLQYKNLPNVFVGDKIFLQKGMENRDTLIRYIISVRIPFYCISTAMAPRLQTVTKEALCK